MKGGGCNCLIHFYGLTIQALLLWRFFFELLNLIEIFPARCWMTPGDASAVQCKLCSSSGGMAEAAAATASGGGGSLVWGWFHTSNAIHL